jgi:pilus assembly protein Flp/PilA
MTKLFVTLQALALATSHRIREEKGATAVEYGLMVGLIAVVIIGTVFTLGGQLDDLFQRVVTELQGPAAP